MVGITTFSHRAIVVNDLQRSVRFYVNVLGFQNIETPVGASELGIQWIATGEKNCVVIHLIPCSAIEKLLQLGFEFDEVGKPRHVMDHIALTVSEIPTGSDFAQLVLENGGKILDKMPRAYSGSPQLFLEDPDSHTVELCGF